MGGGRFSIVLAALCSLLISELSGNAVIIWGWASTMDNYPGKRISNCGENTAFSKGARMHKNTGEQLVTAITSVYQPLSKCPVASWNNPWQNNFKIPPPLHTYTRLPNIILYLLLFQISFPNELAGWRDQIIECVIWVDHYRRAAQTQVHTHTHTCTVTRFTHCWADYFLLSQRHFFFKKKVGFVLNCLSLSFHGKEKLSPTSNILWELPFICTETLSLSCI